MQAPCFAHRAAAGRHVMLELVQDKPWGACPRYRRRAIQINTDFRFW
jgi:hypothetical protein